MLNHITSQGAKCAVARKMSPQTASISAIAVVDNDMSRRVARFLEYQALLN